MDLGSTPGGASIIEKKPALVAGFFVSGFPPSLSHYFFLNNLLCITSHLLP
ncbi:hypothetical protein VCRA2121O337_710001 [Vibrio crassostreae]|nr:hypothetical protein VCRA2120E331_720002 [Vibrio crassostreae]CAK3600662.1 hypothetical protein VCRA2127O345_720002 [Vibrio crassostreae]CAK3606628.1 hypothetical protein VCRA2120E330_700001 [Vibrio crassostreae]CAK3635215.1 hypothetical protein VCRA2122O338_700001 [Vibrio crassostreae]CAK3697012.1 hypothetical protein VCRA2122O340_710001 [Vibrio crassostreae]